METEGRDASRVIFLPATMDGLPRQAPSPRIRARWVCQYWDGAEVFDGSQVLTQYDVFVFQKAYLSETARALAARYRAPDRMMAFDCCDAEFENPAKLGRLMAMLELMDFCVVPTGSLAAWFARWLPTYVVRDRLDLAAHTPKTGEEMPLGGNGPGILWFGGHQNYPALEPLLGFLEGHGLRFVTLCDRPHPGGCEWIPWESVEQANEVIRRADIVLNPQPDWGLFRYKSDNKTATAWACGVVVAHDEEELRFLLPLSRAERLDLGREYRALAEQEYDCRLSAEEWRRIIDLEREQKALLAGEGAAR